PLARFRRTLRNKRFSGANDTTGQPRLCRRAGSPGDRRRATPCARLPPRSFPIARWRACPRGAGGGGSGLFPAMFFANATRRRSDPELGRDYFVIILLGAALGVCSAGRGGRPRRK